MNMCSKYKDKNRDRNKKVEIMFIVAMLVPFLFKTTLSYFYWIAVVCSYLAYLNWRWKL